MNLGFREMPGIFRHLTKIPDSLLHTKSSVDACLCQKIEINLPKKKPQINNLPLIFLHLILPLFDII